jgi:carboxyl-terminal processing protease
VIDIQEPKKNDKDKQEISSDLNLELQLENQVKKYKSLKNVTAFFVVVTIFASLFIGLLLGNRFGNSIEIEKNTLRNEVLELINEKSIRQIPDQKYILESELRGLVSSLDDPYSSYFPAIENENFEDSLNQRYEGVGILFETVEGQIIVQQVFNGSPAKGLGILNGDILQKVDGKDVRNQEIGEVAKKIRGEKGTKVKLEFLRNLEILEFEVTRDKIELELITLEFLENDTVAHLKISSFGDNLSVLMEDKIQQIQTKNTVKNIILDLRDNGGGLLDQTVEVASYFIPKNEVVLIEKTKTEEKVLTTNAKSTNLQDYGIIVLVNDFSASASEILAGSLRDQRNAKLVGSTTFGKGTVQQIFNLRNGDKLKLTIAEWFTPKKTAIDKIGLEPDVLVNPDEDALKKALEIIKEENKKEK